MRWAQVGIRHSALSSFIVAVVVAIVAVVAVGLLFPLLVRVHKHVGRASLEDSAA
jgi:hypothetical protein